MKLAKFDIYKATLEFSEVSTQIVQRLRLFDDQRAQYNTVQELIKKIEDLGLEGEEYARELQVERVINYCTANIYMPVYHHFDTFIKTIRDKTQIDYSRLIVKDKDNKPLPPKIVSSSGEILLALINNGAQRDRLNFQNLNGMHVSINPISYLYDASIKIKPGLRDEISNSLESFYEQKKKQKGKKRAGIFTKMMENETSKYQQIIKFFEQEYAINCISFDYMFDGKKFKKHCGLTNPFDKGIIFYLDLSMEYAFISGKYLNPKFDTKVVDAKSLLQLKNKNIEIMTQKAYKNLYVLFDMLADSQNVKMLEMINLSGVHLTDGTIAQLGRVLKNGNVKYLNLNRAHITKQGLKDLQEALKHSHSIECLLLEDLTFYHTFVQPASCLSKKKKVFIYSQLLDKDYSTLLQEVVVYAKKLKEIYLSWNRINHMNVHYTITEYEQGTDEYKKQHIIQNDCLGPLGKLCYEEINSILQKNSLQICEARYNQLPFEQIQLYAISLKGNDETIRLDLTGNTEMQDLDGFSCCCACDCCIDCCQIFVEKCCGCFSSCFHLEDVPRLLVKKEVLEDIAKSCEFNKNKPYKESFKKQLREKYDKYVIELKRVQDKEKEEQQKRKDELERKKKEEEERKRLLQEEEFKKQYLLNQARAGKHFTNMQVHHDGKITNIGEMNDITTTIPLSIQSKDPQLAIQLGKMQTQSTFELNPNPVLINSAKQITELNTANTLNTANNLNNPESNQLVKQQSDENKKEESNNKQQLQSNIVLQEQEAKPENQQEDKKEPNQQQQQQPQQQQQQQQQINNEQQELKQQVNNQHNGDQEDNLLNAEEQHNKINNSLNFEQL